MIFIFIKNLGDCFFFFLFSFFVVICHFFVLIRYHSLIRVYE